MPTFTPPTLRFLVTLRNPSKKPETQRDEYGGDIAPPEWGVKVWAARRDRSPGLEIEEKILIRELTTIWTIRERAGVDANAEIVYGGEVYQAVGPAMRIGGPDYGLASKFLMIETTLRK